MNTAYQGEYTVEFIALWNSWCKAKTREIRQKSVDNISGFDWDFSHVLSYGQSLSTGQEGWPALSCDARHDNLLMLGRSVHGQSMDKAARWAPISQIAGQDAVFQPMSSAVLDDLGDLLTIERQLNLPVGNQNLGETPLESALNFLCGKLNNREMELGVGRKRVVGSVCGVSGKTIEQLSRNSMPDLFGRLSDCRDLVLDASKRAGGSYGISALLFIQGEYNYWPQYSGTGDKYVYRYLLDKLYKDIRETVVGNSKSDQARSPALFFVQTGAAFTNDQLDLSIGQAQFEFSLVEPRAILVGPYYPVTDKGGHLDANGYRWLGSLIGKVMTKVLLGHEGWRPLSPMRIINCGRTILVAFHVPEPPLMFDKPYVGRAPCSWPNKGFTVLDADGVVPITGVEIVADHIVAISIGRELTRNGVLRYADQTVHGGNGMLRDSDPTLGYDNYIQSDWENSDDMSASPAGKPYPLWNWCIAFNLPILRDISYPGNC